MKISKNHRTGWTKTGHWILFLEDIQLSGQIIATSHDLTPNGASVGNPLISGKARLVKYYNLPRTMALFHQQKTSTNDGFRKIRNFHGTHEGPLNICLLQMCQGLNSYYFHIIGDKLINPIVGVYIPIIRIPIKGGRSPIPNFSRLLTMAQICFFTTRWKGKKVFNTKSLQLFLVENLQIPPAMGFCLGGSQRVHTL